jgi:hypothetical protein
VKIVQQRRVVLETKQDKPARPGSALPYISPDELAEMQRRRREDPNYIEKLLAEGKAEFDAKWGIDPITPTDYDSRI